MKITTYQNAEDFHDACLPLLLEHEAENILMVGIVLHLCAGKPGWSNVRPKFFGIEDSGKIIGAALQTPPHNIILAYPASPQTAVFLAEYLHKAGLQFPGVLGGNKAVESFKNHWQQLTGLNAQKRFSLRIYKLTEVDAPRETQGTFRIADENDAELILEWHAAFAGDAGTDNGNRERILKNLSEGSFLLWCDPEPVCMVGSDGATTHGIRVAPVYTPPGKRNKGYATAATAAMSSNLLESGYSFCCLFTDLANPTSNSIYQKIGYRPVCDFTDCKFVQ